MDADVQLGSGRAITSPTVTCAGRVVVQHAGQRHLLDAADRLAVVAAPGSCEMPGRLHQLDGLRRRGAPGRSVTSLPRAACFAAGRRPSGPGLGRPVRLVLGQPGVVEELAQVVAAGVGAEGDDQVVAGQPAGVAQGGGDVRAGRAAQRASPRGGPARGRCGTTRRRRRGPSRRRAGR